MPTFYQTLKSMRTGSCLMDLLQPWHLARFLRCSKGMVSQVLTGGGGPTETRVTAVEERARSARRGRIFLIKTSNN